LNLSWNFIIGLTGGGKTNTVKSLLYNIDKLYLPFMVIEPAKKGVL